MRREKEGVFEEKKKVCLIVGQFNPPCSTVIYLGHLWGFEA